MNFKQFDKINKDFKKLKDNSQNAILIKKLHKYLLDAIEDSMDNYQYEKYLDFEESKLMLRIFKLFGKMK